MFEFEIKPFEEAMDEGSWAEAKEHEWLPPRQLWRGGEQFGWR